MREISPEPWRVKVVERIRSIVRQAPLLRHFTAQFELV
jgi:hypothetical protein